MELGLKGKVAVVTGSSRGIGKAVALALASEGCEVALTARDKKELGQAAEEFKKLGVKPLTVPVDLTKPAGAKRLIRETAKRFGRIDILVNNVGGPLHFLPFSQLTDHDWREELEVDLMAPIRACREVLPWMRRQGGGRIINIASISAVEMEEKFPDYRVAKAALIALSKYLSIELASSNILVNAVLPGSVWTPSWEREAEAMAKREGTSVRKMAQRLRTITEAEIPLGRMGRPEEIAQVVTFLASPNLAWMTGALVRIDGGAAKLIL